MAETKHMSSAEATTARQNDRTLDGLRRWGRHALAEAGVPDPGLDARVLLQWAGGLTHGDLIARGERVLDDEPLARYRDAIARRRRREPVSLITSAREFWSLPFEVGPATLAPRPDTETLIEAALDWIDGQDGAALGARNRDWSLLDLGTGTGCILLTLLRELANARGVGVDISGEALSVAARNADAAGVAARAHLVRGRWGDAVDGVFDLIMSNPPYIPTGDLATLDPEVARYEPHLALDGGSDGFDAYRDMIPDVAHLLRPGGVVILEVGSGQASAVAELLTLHDFSMITTRRDLAGIERCLVARLR